MKRLFILSTIVLILSAASVQACSCNYEGPFVKMAPKAQLVAVVKVTRHLTFKDIYGEKTPMSMEVEVIDIYKGTENRKKVTVWGDPGNLCRPYLSAFKEGQYYVIAFYPGYPNRGHDNEKATDYSISVCGAFWLAVDFEKQIASGHIDSQETKLQSLSLSNLKSALGKDTSALMLFNDPTKFSILSKEADIGFAFHTNYKGDSLGLKDFYVIEKIMFHCIDSFNIEGGKRMRDREGQLKVDRNYFIISTSRYKFQVVAAINDHKERVVWVNSFCNAHQSNWRDEIEAVKDGGICYFKLAINLTTKQLMYFVVNGDA